MILNKRCVLIPAYNEEASIQSVITQIANLDLDLDILVIDDGSSDKTRKISRESGAICLTHPINCGVGAALITGLTWALNNQYERIIVVDADGQHPIQNIGPMLDQLDQFDLVVGCRDWKAYDSKYYRRLAHELLRVTLKFKFKVYISDVTSGFRAINAFAAEKLLPELGDQYLEDTIMLLVEAQKKHIRVGSMPVHIAPRQGGEPSHGLTRSVFKYLSVVCKVLLAPKGRRMHD
jgi:glycosyltransferase involved in cell wall biosynthesis